MDNDAARNLHQQRFKSGYANRVLNQTDTPLHWPTRERLKLLINDNEWEEIGRIFGFKPEWTDFHGIRMFNWQSCNADFWKVFQPPVIGTLSPSRIYLKAMAQNAADKKATREGKVQYRYELPTLPPKPEKKKRKRQPKVNLRILYVLQEGRCFYCRHQFSLWQMSIDHRVALSKGGPRAIRNEVAACKPCNNKKGSLREELFLGLEWLKMRRMDKSYGEKMYR